MPDTKSSKNDNDDAKSGGPKKIIIAAVLCAGLLGGGYFAGGMTAGGESTAPVAEAADGETGAVEEEVEEIGELVDLEAVNVNLQEGHFLRVAIALEVEHEEGGGDGHGATDEVHFPSAPAQDLVLTTYSGRTMAELSSAEGREAARAELVESVKAVYGEKVHDIYLTQFVMQ